VLNQWGWQGVNLAVLPALAVALAVTLAWQRQERLAPSAAGV
jgi:hypothetical protein